MNIKEISLQNYRNYGSQNIVLNPNINIFYGNNAQGKTNIIEAIYLSAYGKSFRTQKDKDLIKFGENKALIDIKYNKVDRDGKIRTDISERKTFFINDIKQDKISNIIGKINIVIFTPDDINIIKGEPDKRRRFLDMMISSLRPNYIHLLNRYKNILEERNNYLKQIKFEKKNIELLELWDEQLSDCSAQIYSYRKNYVEKIKEMAQDIHNLITKCGKEDIKIEYISNGKSKEDYLNKLKNTRNQDIARGYTTTGVHRDDLVVYINDKMIGNFGSQGQQRTTILTLKLCELNIIKEEIGETPILLLDDYMSELDEIRRKNFLETIEECQIILTCTDQLELTNNYSTFKVQNGKCVEI